MNHNKKNSPFDFLPLVHELLKNIVSPTSKEIDIQNIVQKFTNRMEEAQKILANTPVLELT